MSKEINSLFMAVVFAAVAAFLAVEGAEAFCVYNETDQQTIQVSQISGGDFRKNINRGGSECCDWQNSNCNKEGKRDSIVSFYVIYEEVVAGGILAARKTICTDFPIQAGGWLTVEGKDKNYRCVRHDY